MPRPPDSPRHQPLVSSRGSSTEPRSALECEQDYSSEAQLREIDLMLDEVMRMRASIATPQQERRLGHYERLYERSLGLAVIPVLLYRLATIRNKRYGAGVLSGTLLRELDHELELGGGRSLKMSLYERSLGLAVLPTLVRRAVYRIRLRAARSRAT